MSVSQLTLIWLQVNEKIGPQTTIKRLGSSSWNYWSSCGCWLVNVPGFDDSSWSVGNSMRWSHLHGSMPARFSGNILTCGLQLIGCRLLDVAESSVDGSENMGSFGNNNSAVALLVIQVRLSLKYTHKMFTYLSDNLKWVIPQRWLTQVFQLPARWTPSKIDWFACRHVLWDKDFRMENEKSNQSASARRTLVVTGWSKE